MEHWLTVLEVAKILNIRPVSIRRKAAREGWEKRMFDGRGGKEYRYRLDSLPEDIQAAYAADLNLTIEALQGELKPALKGGITPEKTHEIAVYKGRSAAEKPVKAWEECAEAEREIARNRREVIAAYEQSGLNVRRFVERYNHDDFLPEIKDRLGRWAYLKDSRRFYDSWLRPYRQFGLAGLVPQYKKKGAGGSLPQDVKNILEYVYLDTTQPSLSAVVRTIKAGYGITVPEDTARRYLKSLPEAVTAHGRRGQRYFEEHYQPSIHRDYTLYKPMDIIVGDYMTLWGGIYSSPPTLRGSPPPCRGVLMSTGFRSQSTLIMGGNSRTTGFAGMNGSMRTAE
jgi:hypothetical protein